MNLNLNLKGGITDADVDAILARGEERTKELKERIQSGIQHNLKDFTLDGGFDETQIIGLEDPSAKGGKNGGMMIALPQRARKTNYDVDQYYRDAMSERSKQESTGGRDTRKIKVPMMHDYQVRGRRRVTSYLYYFIRITKVI